MNNKFILLAIIAITIFATGIVSANVFPTSLNSFVEGDEIEEEWGNALETKMGIDNSTVSTSLDYIVKSTSGKLGKIRSFSTSTGGTIYADGSNWARLGIGSNGQIMTISSGIPAWVSTSTLNALTPADIDTYSELNTIVADQTLTHNNLINTYSELNAIVSDVTLTHNGLINTYNELNTIVADVTLTHNGLIDTFNELNAIVADQTLINSGVTTLSSLVSVGTLATATWNATAIGTQYGGTGQNFSSSDGFIFLTSGVASASSTISSGKLDSIVILSTEIDTLSELDAIVADSDIASTTAAMIGTLDGFEGITLYNTTSTQMANDDFGIFSCDGTDAGCSLDVSYLPLTGGTISGTLTVSATSTLATTTIIGDLSVGEKFTLADVTTQSITSSSTTILSSDAIIEVSSDADYLMSATPAVATGTDGQLLVLKNTGSYDIDLQDDTDLPGSSFFHGGTTGSLEAGGIMTFVFLDSLGGAGGWIIQSHPNTQIGAEFGQPLDVRNVSGSSIGNGVPVYATGFNAGQNRVTIAPADADDSNTMPAIGITTATIANGSNGTVITSGLIENRNTSAYAVGDTLYVSTTTGALTSTKPTVDSVQALGIVVRSSATKGAILVQGAGRVNDVPWDATFTNATSTNLTVSGTLTATLTGNADTATALAANGANCAAGQYPLGVDASGAVESCTVAGVGYWTQTGSDIYYEGRVGIATTSPSYPLFVSTTTSPQFRLGYDAANYSDFAISSGGDLTITASGGDIDFDNENLYTTGELRVGTTTSATQLHIVKAGTQMRLSYDSVNYGEMAIGSGGDLTISASGGDISFGDENISGTGVWNLGAASSTEIENNATLELVDAGAVGVDTTTGQFRWTDGTTIFVESGTKSKCGLYDNLVAANDNISLGSLPYAATIQSIWCSYIGTGTVVASTSLEDGSGNAMTHTIPTCTAHGTPPSAQTISAGGSLSAYEILRFDVDNTPDPITDDYTICVSYTIDAD